MKLKNIKLSLAALAALTLASCSEGQYWDAASDPGTVYAFPKTTETVSIDADATVPSSYEVTVMRNTSAGSLTIPVTFTSTSPLLTGDSSVTFADGQNQTKYVINIATGLKAGITYTATVQLEEPSNTIIDVDADNLKYTLNISQVLVLNWVDNGVANAYSTWWVANDEPVEIPVQEATNWPNDGERLMRLVSPYWYFEPDYADAGYNFMYYLDDDGNPLSMYSNYQYIGENDEGYYYYFGCPSAYGCSFYKEGDLYVMYGVIGYASSASASSVTAYGYETIYFTWTGQ